MLKRQMGQTQGLMIVVVRGAAASLIGMLLCASILAKLLDEELMKLENVGYGILASHLLAVFLGARVAITGAGKKGAVAAAATGAVYCITLLLVNGLFFGGSFTGFGTTLLLVVLATGAAVMMEEMGGRRKGSRRYKIRK